MKRLICLLLVALLLTSCSPRTIAPAVVSEESYATPAPTPQPTDVPTPEPTIEHTATPRPALPTFAPQSASNPLFAEELLSEDAEPIASLIHALLGEDGMTKEAFHAKFIKIIQRMDAIDEGLLKLSDKGRTLTAKRKEKTVYALIDLMSSETLAALQEAYAACSGEGDALPVKAYVTAIGDLSKDVLERADRSEPFYSLDGDGARDYLSVLSRRMGESVLPRVLFDGLESLAQTEAYALAAALRADPEVGRKKEPISYGDSGRNLSFLCWVTEQLCPSLDGSRLPIPYAGGIDADADLFHLAYRLYPGLAYLNAYAAHAPEGKRERWANAPDGYLHGLAVHGSYAILPYLADEFGLEYVQYRWYEDMLDRTLTGIVALCIHYYGYSKKSLASYLEGWGVAEHVDYLYAKAMSDPFDSVVDAYGYWQYLDVCEAALDAGCPTVDRFYRDYLAAGPAPFQELKEYMVGLYKNEG